ncbi:2-polyprenyl-6-methoxyphenol hydroxylase-like FAD-dependent oxidoreductase [Chitinophaga terrae (ex Kim and Jung 2007)]|uniref:hypothetical protein n=1 Tax=Chitinophaga terrae (ex Kim and Jung 2007) TaxID=408074 RepID=UPI0027877A81|nr:hypothetical protein [Chitinophaga terrae (ex Kim and Jung 2007)]MDQ0110555.1 2-polyprenyl-6-methoxyphenol hydroxylase-like FAD-dependent oxidoreductase [Chitinophaga terrae (ex Kim and Jung 2007)]
MPVDIKDQTIDIVKRMGLFEQIKAKRIGVKKWEFKNADNVTEKSLVMENLLDNQFEIERNTLLNLLFDSIKADVQFIFNNSIIALNETKESIEVAFKDGSQQTYDLVFFTIFAIRNNKRKLYGNKCKEWVGELPNYKTNY